MLEDGQWKSEENSWLFNFIVRHKTGRLQTKEIMF